MSAARGGAVLILVLGPCMIISCGMVGAPVAPETVGVAPIIQRQKQLQSSPGTGSEPASAPVPVDESERIGPVGQDEELPPLRPIGTR
jgi:hypothetical protein